MNELAGALSPYLRQHAGNPVAWRQWGPAALADAAARDVPLLVSIGYSTCHWCHVMAHESFEDRTVAAAINDRFVPVKVDREERPDLDAVYMQATMAITGQGGWPMTVFAFPDGTPFFAGMYFPKAHFLRLLDAVHAAWTDQREELRHQGAAIVEASAAGGPAFADVTVACPLDGPCPPAPPIREAMLDRAAEAVLASADAVHGGFGSAPKFPSVPTLRFLCDAYVRTGDARLLDHVRLSAERMARGGIRDQLEGGFARYSVDASWTVPHFEKMLYDNAELLWLYARLAGEGELFARVADETAAFLLERFSTAEGAFAAAFDADTEGVEGATYVWTFAELEEVLGGDAAWAAAAFGVDPGRPNFEHGANVLELPRDPEDGARFAAVRHRLAEARRKRPQPARDDKVVAAWNGLAIAALAEYSSRTGRRDALLAAERAAAFLAERHLGADGRLARASLGGQVSAAPGILEDYAAVALGFLRLGGAWTGRAQALLEQVRARFGDGLGGFFDTAADAEELVSRPADVHDGPTASGWALAAAALLEAYEATGDETYKDDAWRAIARAEPVMSRNPRFTAGLHAAAEALVRVQR
ncbi:thioredoxin domain-containing protein [Glycomyces terrestris]|uniref:Thioredoxin domain-containing protein n=1 Tax=Glycomyces terrestris TaxID=2493553 RepID=A0A426UWV5_9ACTN|nr:thioredoxin domain-containing protein [Glycomyces terrestris]RRR99113.1 thioredoxin domain-containing protein [Glycomyces terrestris]